MKKRQAEKIAKKGLFVDYRLFRFTTRKKVYNRLGKLACKLPFVDPEYQSKKNNRIFEVINFTSRHWYNIICLNQKLNSTCVLKYQKRSIPEMFDEYKEYSKDPQSLVVAYQKSGIFNKWDAEILIFDFIVGPVGKVQTKFANQTLVC